MVRNGFGDNRPLWAAELNALQSAPGSFGVVDGCTPTEGTGDWDVDVASGTVRVDGTGDVSVSGQTVDLADPTGGMNSGETRVVLVTVDASGTASDTAGTAATNPASPDIPTDEVLVAVVVVAAADASISDSDLYDPRVVINDGADSGVNADLVHGNYPLVHGTDTDAPSDAHHARYTDSEVRSFIVSQHATENGTISNTGASSESVSFSNTFDVLFGTEVYITGPDNDAAIDAGFSTFSTGGSGNITGGDIQITNTFGTVNVHWRVWGLTTA